MTQSRITVAIPFDIEKESLYCGACGQKCVVMGHMTGRFLLCPTHGEFTIAPVVMFVHAHNAFMLERGLDNEGQWEIQFESETSRAMWETCRFLTDDAARDAGEIAEAV